MSVEKAKAFLDRASRDKAFRESLREPTRKAWESVLKLAKKHGYECTGAELHNALRTKLGARHIPKANEDDEANCILIAPKP